MLQIDTVLFSNNCPQSPSDLVFELMAKQTRFVLSSFELKTGSVVTHLDQSLYQPCEASGIVLLNGLIALTLFSL
jgi:hypothetical protein